MNYRFSNKINYEEEASRLIAMHYGEQKGYRGWLKDALERNKQSQSCQEWLENIMEPLIALEEEVFKEVSISEKDYQLYFTNRDFDSDSIGDSLMGVFNEMEHLHLKIDENERKKIFASYVLPDFSYEQNEAAPGIEEFFRSLQNSSLDTAFKWECCEIYSNLEKHIAYVNELIHPMIRILKRHEETLLQLIHDNRPEGTPYFLKDDQSFGKLNVNEILVDFSVFGFNGILVRLLDVTPDVGYLHYGIYVDAIVREKSRQEQSGLQAADKWKSLSDKSRIKILCLLKEREMFGQELKEALGLSNATISHHMNALLVDDFVSMRKDGSRILYSLNREKIGEALDEMRHLLLD